VLEFFAEFPSDEACLEWLWRSRHAPDGEHSFCPRCAKVRSFHRYTGGTRVRQVWTCTSCSLQLSPTAGTVFHKSSTSLQLWFYAIWLMTSTRCGVSAKQLERELGVTYKTAWRMFNLIRNRLMADEGGLLQGDVEADETWIGGQTRNHHRREREKLGWDRKRYDNERKTIVFAAVERDGRVRATIIPNSGGHTLRNQVREWVDAGSILYTDEYGGYCRLEMKYDHRTIRHRDKTYVDGDTHTQTVEGFFALLKNAIRGVHHGVSDKWLQGYINEYCWRWNHRHDAKAMFHTLVQRSAFTS
jgi:transposase-like protein